MKLRYLLGSSCCKYFNMSWVQKYPWCFQNGYCGYGYGSALWHTAVYRGPVPRCHGYSRVTQTQGEFIIFIIICTYDNLPAEICDRAEFETPPNIVFGTLPPPPTTHPWTSSCRGPAVEGPLFSGNPRCTTRAQVRRDGGWKRVGRVG